MGQRGVRRVAGRLWWLPLAPLGLAIDRGSRRRWLSMPAIVMATAVASSAAKLLVRRPRPDSPYSRAPRWRLDAAGFPSTHSACAFAVAGWMRGSRHGRRLHLVAVLIGCLRVQRRAHHLADVVAGAILGYALVWRVDRTWERVSARRGTVRTAGGSRPTPPERRAVGSVALRGARQRGDHFSAPGDRGSTSRID